MLFKGIEWKFGLVRKKKEEKKGKRERKKRKGVAE